MLDIASIDLIVKLSNKAGTFLRVPSTMLAINPNPCQPEMKRGSFLCVLLSLLLLLSPQLALSHAMSHWNGSTDKSVNVELDGMSKPSKLVAHGHSCAHCFAYAQLASAISNSTYALPAVDVKWVHLASPASFADCTRTVCVFQSRAPPQAQQS